jgi:hypothetical protein
LLEVVAKGEEEEVVAAEQLLVLGLHKGGMDFVRIC